MKPLFTPSERVQKLPPYIFSKLDLIKKKAQEEGKSLLALGIGDPDLPTPEFILRALHHSVQQPENQKYPSYIGKLSFREAACTWSLKRFGITINPVNECMAVIGSKEGIAHLPLAFVNPGDGVLMPSIGYPVYFSSTLFAGGEPLPFEITEDNHYQPDFEAIERQVIDFEKKGKKVKLWFFNYPHNPTAATARPGTFEAIVALCAKYHIIACHDHAYSEIYFDNHKTPSFLATPGAKDIGCEFHSLSKTYNMTGFRVGFFIGHASIIAGLTTIKTNIDSGVFNACQDAAIAALQDTSGFCDQLRAIYQARRDVLVPLLQRWGLRCALPEATFYVWAQVPKSHNADTFAQALIEKIGIIGTPGNGFGRTASQYIRFTLCSDIEILKKVEALLRIPLEAV